MNAKIIFCLALVLSGGLVLSRADETKAVAATNSSVVKIVNPQGSVDLPMGQAIFSIQPSNFLLQVPIGGRKIGEILSMTNYNALDLQVWLLKADGASIPQLHKPSMSSIGSLGDYVTDYMDYEFPKVPVNELSGVVVRLNGKLYCHKIEKTGSKP